jgi:NTP pyrophosphatase (non-canonical NTP hydrolase)
MVEPEEVEAMTLFTEDMVHKARFDNEFSTYQYRTSDTAVYPNDVALHYLALGVFGECGEIANKVKKMLRGDYDGKGVDAHNKAVDGIIDEAGDVMWYCAQLLLKTNVDFGNLSKYETFEDYSTSQKKLASTYTSGPAELVLQLGRSVGYLSDIIGGQGFDDEYIGDVTTCVMSITQSICLLALVLDRPFTSIFTLNLDKLKERSGNNTIKGDNRG